MTVLLEAAGRLEDSELGRAATAVAREQVALAAAFALLAGRLDAAAGMAGDDEPGRAFAGVYGPAVDAAFAGFVATVRVLDGVTTTLVTTGNNHARAESASDAGPRQLLSTAIGTLCEHYGALVADTHGSIRRAVGPMLAGGILIGGTGIGLAVVAYAELAAVEAFLNPIADEFAAPSLPRF